MSLSSCVPDYGISKYPICSGHGDCIEGQCVCHGSWSGYSDFALNKGYDCDINTYSIQIWGYFNAIISATIVIIILGCMYHERTFMIKNYHKCKSICYHSFLVMNVNIFIYSVCKIINPTTYVIGKSIILSFTSANVMCFSMVGVWMYIEIVMKFMKSYSKMINSAVRDRLHQHIHIVSIILPIVTLLLNAVIILIFILCLLFPSHDCDHYSISFLITIIMIFVYYASSILYILHRFLYELELYLNLPEVSSFKTRKIVQQIYNKLSLVNKVIKLLLIPGILLEIMFVSWNMLRRKVVYLVSFQLGLVSIATGLIVLSIISRGRRSEDAVGTLSASVSSRMIFKKRIYIDVFKSPSKNSIKSYKYAKTGMV